MIGKQDIVPVQLRDEKQTINTQLRNQKPQKLIARLKSGNSELFIYEGVRKEIIRVLLSELSIHETR